MIVVLLTQNGLSKEYQIEKSKVTKKNCCPSFVSMFLVRDYLIENKIIKTGEYALRFLRFI